ncbi:hypothetical protein [Streptomyces mirabilis]|uniref:hypothetical protein n=1 Tax=Streptomyces mirabilis TaxID=68239 RepID=UPI00365B7B3A
MLTSLRHCPGADGIWEIDSLGLVEPLARLDAGRDRNGLPTPRVVVPHRRPLRSRRRGPRRRDRDDPRQDLRRGPLPLTRPAFETAGPCPLEAPGGDRVPVLVAVSLLSGFAAAECMAYEVPGAHIPQDTLTALDVAGERAGRRGRARPPTC